LTFATAQQLAQKYRISAHEDLVPRN